MSAFSTYSANKALDHILLTATWTAPSAVYVGLFTSDAGLDSNTSASWTEISGGSYARSSIVSAFSAASSGTATNTLGSIIFPTATADWGTATHFALLDAATAGNVLFWGPLTSSQDITFGESPRFLTDTLTLLIA